MNEDSATTNRFEQMEFSLEFSYNIEFKAPSKRQHQAEWSGVCVCVVVYLCVPVCTKQSQLIINVCTRSRAFLISTRQI